MEIIPWNYACMKCYVYRFEQVKIQNELLKQQAVDGDDTAVVEEVATEGGHINSATNVADNTEDPEEMSHSSIVTSACVAYRCAVDRNPNDRVDSVVYAVPFDNH